ncbi:hypothetical protein QTP88_011615 [Uroleucon formosanum]
MINDQGYGRSKLQLTLSTFTSIDFSFSFQMRLRGRNPHVRPPLYPPELLWSVTLRVEYELPRIANITESWHSRLNSEKRKKSCLLNDKVIGSKGLAKCLLMFYEEEKKYNFFYGVAANLIYLRDKLDEADNPSEGSLNMAYD